MQPILLFSICYNLPRFFELEIRLQEKNNNSTTSLQPLSNLSDIVEPIEMTANESSIDENATAILFELAPTKFRLNYYYYTIYLVSGKTFLGFLWRTLPYIL